MELLDYLHKGREWLAPKLFILGVVVVVVEIRMWAAFKTCLLVAHQQPIEEEE